MFVEELLKSIRDRIEKAWPTQDLTRNFSMTGGVDTLPNETCKTCTIFNTTGSDIVITIRGGANLTIPDNIAITIDCTNTNQITVDGTVTTLEYVVSY